MMTTELTIAGQPIRRADSLLEDFFNLLIEGYINEESLGKLWEFLVDNIGFGVIEKHWSSDDSDGLDLITSTGQAVMGYTSKDFDDHGFDNTYSLDINASILVPCSGYSQVLKVRDILRAALLYRAIQI